VPFPLAHVALAAEIVCKALQRFDALAAPCPTKVFVGSGVSTAGDEHLKARIPATFSKVFYMLI